LLKSKTPKLILDFNIFKENFLNFDGVIPKVKFPFPSYLVL